MESIFLFTFIPIVRFFKLLNALFLKTDAYFEGSQCARWSPSGDMIACAGTEGAKLLDSKNVNALYAERTSDGSIYDLLTKLYRLIRGCKCSVLYLVTYSTQRKRIDQKSNGQRYSINKSNNGTQTLLNFLCPLQLFPISAPVVGCIQKQILHKNQEDH